MDRPYNSEHFGLFIDQLLDHFQLNEINEATLIMDNVGFHHNNNIINTVRNKGHKIIFLPPYSPFLNPIEEVFSKWKCLVRAANCMNEDDLYNKIHTASELITASDVQGYFRHMQSFIPRCIRKENIE